MKKVIDWITDARFPFPASICQSCEAELKKAGKWIHGGDGREYCTVHKGLHAGRCDRCENKHDLNEW